MDLTNLRSTSYMTFKEVKVSGHCIQVTGKVILPGGYSTRVLTNTLLKGDPEKVKVVTKKRTLLTLFGAPPLVFATQSFASKKITELASA